ncbi:MAG: thrombospondin type 3 repeat-containing protein, partial [Candidatus Magasanikiibacteriota bacterium]
NCPKKPNPDQSDADYDGVGNACDNCPEERNRRENPGESKRYRVGGDGSIIGDPYEIFEKAKQPDKDGDGIGDECDFDGNDVDGDGIINGADNCPHNPNKGQSNLDHDGLGDACDDDADGDEISKKNDRNDLDPNKF